MSIRLRRGDAAVLAAALLGLLFVLGVLLRRIEGVDAHAIDALDPPPVGTETVLAPIAAEQPPEPTPPPATVTPPPPPPTPALRALGAVATPVVAPPTATVVPTAQPSPTRAFARTGPGQGVPILMYHYIRVNPVASDTIGYGLSITPPLFAAHMAFLADRGFRAITMRELEPYVGTGKVPDEKSVVVTLDDGYRDAYTEAWPVLKRHGFAATIYMVSGLVENSRYLTARQLRELNAAGIEIGGHSASHADLTALGAARLRAEVADSRAALERILGGPVTSFCYPAGKNSPAVLEAVRAAGYTSATTVQPGIFRGREERLAIPRVRVYGGMGLSALARAIGEPPPDPATWRGFLTDVPNR